MSVPVAVISPLPALERGLVSLLASSSFVPEVPDHPLDWVGLQDRRAALVTVQSPEDLRVVVDLRAARDDLVIVVLMPEATVDAIRRALVAGATSAAGWDATRDTVIALLNAGLTDHSLLPAQVARQFATSHAGDSNVPGLEPGQAEWLRALARGATVADLAAGAGYSEREMYRLLKTVYECLSVRNRTEALVRATQLGIVN